MRIEVVEFVPEHLLTMRWRCEDDRRNYGVLIDDVQQYYADGVYEARAVIKDGCTVGIYGGRISGQGVAEVFSYFNMPNQEMLTLYKRIKREMKEMMDSRGVYVLRSVVRADDDTSMNFDLHLGLRPVSIIMEMRADGS